MKRILLLLLILPFVSRAQVYNPVPDMIFKGQLSAGRSSKTDTSAYMSIGPARGANRGFMAPMVSDTNVVIHPRRDGLLIFSLQRRNFMYWDSLSVRWREFSVSTIDTGLVSTRAWRQKGIDSVASLPRITSVSAGTGMSFTTITSSGAVNADTSVLATRSRVQKPVDSLGVVKQNVLTLTTLGTTGPATLAGSVLNIPNYSPGSGFLRNVAPIGSVPNANGMSKFGDTLRLQPASINFGGVVTTGTQTFGGEKIFNDRLRVGSSGGALIQNTDQFSVGIGNNSLSSSLLTISNNTALGYNSGSSNVAGLNNVFVGSRAGDLISTGQNNTSSMNSVFLGADARPLGDNQGNQIVIGSGARGNGANTTTIGTNLTTKTYLKGGLNIATIDSVSPTASLLFASSGDVVRSGRVPTSAIDTSVISTRSWRQKGIDSLSAAKQNNLTLTTSGSSGASTLVNSVLNVPNYTLAGLGGVPTNRVITINGESLDLSTDRSWTIAAGGTGTVTSVSAGTGMTFPTITTTGAVNADTMVLATRSRLNKVADSVSALISGGGLGTVTSVASGFGTNFSTITNTGTVVVDSVVMATRNRVQKAIDSLSSVKQNNLSLTTTGSSGASTLINSTLNVPNYTLSGLGGVPTTRNLTINGTQFDLSADRSWTISGGGSGTVTSVSAGTGMNFSTITTTGSVSADTGTLATRAWRQKGIDSVVNLIATSGGGTVLSVSAGTGMNFSTITSTGSVAADTNVLATRARVQKPVDSLGVVKQNNIGLTTTGSSGASTFNGTTLNVPNYTLSGLGGVPTTRNLTINGAQFDLSADRSWTIPTGTGTVTSVASGVGMNFSTITNTGTVSADTGTLATRAWRQKGIDSVASVKQNNLSLTTTGNNGASTLVNSVLNVPNYTISGLGGVPTSRALTINGTTFDLSSDRSWTISAGTGTVTSVTGGFGLTGGTITTSGTLALDTASMATRARVQKGIDSVAGLPRITGSGVSGYMARWTGASTQDTSRIFQSGNLIGINTTSPSERLDVDGKIRARVIDSSNTPSNYLWSDATGVIRKAPAVSLTTTGSSGASTLSAGVLNVPNYTLSGLGGVPTSRTLTINGTQFDLSADRSWTISAGSGTVTSVGTGYGLTGGTITTTGTIVADTNQLSSKAWRQKAVDTINATRVPNGRTLTINGTSFDLSANRTWTIASADMDSTSMTAASGWAFCRDISWDDQINELVKTNKNNTIQTITLQGAVYKTTSTFTTGAWVTVANIPTGWEPDNVVYGSMSNYVDGADYEHANGTAFSGNAYYEGACVFRINTNGNVQVRADVVTNSATLSGSNYVIFPIHIVYIIKYIPT